MKSLVSLVCMFGIFLLSTGGFAAEKLSFSQSRMMAGKASLTENGYIITRHLGTANFSPELRLPLDLVYNSVSDRTGYTGFAWSIPQLESTAIPHENGVMWTTPWGEQIRFFTKENPSRRDVSKMKEEIAVNDYFTDNFMEWQAEGQLKRGNWKFTGLRDHKGWELVYRNALLTSIKSPKGNEISIVYQGNRPAFIAENGVRFVEFQYNRQQITALTINGITHNFSYESASIARLPETLAGKVNEFVRPRLTSIKTGDLAPVEFSYDAQSYLTKISQGGRTEELLVDNETLEDRREYLNAARKLIIERQMGVRPERKLISGRLRQDADFKYTYGSYKPGRVTLTDKLDRKAVYDFDSQAGVLAVTGFNGLSQTVYYYMRHDVAYHGKLRQIKDGKHRTVAKYEYDKATGKLTSVEDVAGNEFFFSYDKENQLIEVQRQSAGASREPFLKYEYDKKGNPEAIIYTDAAGKAVLTRSIKYNSEELPSLISDGQHSQAISYNKFGYPLFITDAFGQQNRYEFDRYNRLTATVSPYGVRREYSYTAAGLISKIENKGRTSASAEALSSLSIEYNNQGQPVSYTDQAGRTKKFERDEFGRVVKEFFPDDTSVEYSYNAIGQLAQVLDPNRHEIKFDWDKFGLGKRTTAAEQLTEYTYDRYGLVKQVDSKFEGKATDRSIKYNYDKFDRVTKITYAKGEVETFQYDSWGRLTASTRGERSAAYKYDYFGRLVEKEENGPESKITNRYEYNAWGQRTLRETVTNGLKLTETTTYDKLGRIARIESGGNTVTYEYNLRNQLIRRTANRMPVYYTYTEYGQLETKTLDGRYGDGKTLASLKYIYARDGQITAREVNGKLQEYKYDPKGQLLEVVGSEKYVYDPAGNILSKTVNGKTTTFTYDAANQLASSTVDGKTTDYRYDGAGRLVQEGGKSYQYGYLDKILNVLENGQQIAQFDYHINGQIANAMYGDKKESFLWDGLALIQRDATTLINEPAITGGNPIMAGDNPIFEDLLGTSLGTAANGRFQANELTAFGEPVNASSDNFFTGKPFIGELGYAFLFRNYRPTQGKWQTQDPITLATLLPDYKPLSENEKRNLGYPDGWNNLAYVNNNVTMYIDWQGTEWVIVVNDPYPIDPQTTVITTTKTNATGSSTTVTTTVYNWVLTSINTISDTSTLYEVNRIFTLYAYITNVITHYTRSGVQVGTPTTTTSTEQTSTTTTVKFKKIWE